MKRRHYLICSIIAMLSIVSYACETEYAICEGCGISAGDQNQSQNDTVNTGNTGNTGGSGEDSNNPSGGENAGNNGEGNGPGKIVCNDDIQKCAENLKGKQVCKGSKWENDEACNYCFNENTSNKVVKEVGCGKCTPNSYDELETAVCYKGDFKKFESKATSDDANLGVVINSDSKSDDAPWEFAYNNNGPLKYYNCHNNNVLGSIKEGSGGG